MSTLAPPRSYIPEPARPRTWQDDVFDALKTVPDVFQKRIEVHGSGDSIDLRIDLQPNGRIVNMLITPADDGMIRVGRFEVPAADVAHAVAMEIGNIFIHSKLAVPTYVPVS